LGLPGESGHNWHRQQTGAALKHVSSIRTRDVGRDVCDEICVVGEIAAFVTHVMFHLGI
jgi:hypothetical protein